MKGKADAKWPSQQVDYVKVVSGGKMLDKFGVEVKKWDNGIEKPKDNPRSHIAVSEWMKWKNRLNYD